MIYTLPVVAVAIGLVPFEVFSQTWQPLSAILAETDGSDSEVLAVSTSLRVTMTAVAGQPDAVFAQDGSLAVQIRGLRSTSQLQPGDSVQVEGNLVVRGAVPVIVARSLSRIDAERLVPKPTALDYSRTDLTPYAGRLVRLDGYVFGQGSDETGQYVLISRTSGPLRVRFGNSSASSRRWVQGEFVRVTGIVRPGLASKVATYQELLASSQESVESAWFRRPLMPLAITLGALVLASLLLLGFRIIGRVKRIRDRPFRAIFEQGGDAMILTDERLRVLDANNAACRLLSQSPTQVRFRKLGNLLEIEEGQDLAQIASGLRTGGPESFEAGLWGDQSQGVDLDVTLSHIRVRRKDYVLASMHDVSRHTDSVERFKHFHEELLDGLPIEVAVLSTAGKYIYRNRFGVSDTNFLRWLPGKSDLELCTRLGISSDVALRRRAHRRRAVSSREAVSFDELLETGNGQKRYYIRTYQPILEAGGSPAAVASYALDVTDPKLMQARLDEAKLEVDKVGRLKEAFVQNINQEFRTPITGIIGFAEILSTEVPDEQREFVHLIERNGRRLMSTLNAVLELAGLERNEFDLNLRVLNLSDEVAESVEACRDSAADKGLFLKFEPSRGSALARADDVCLSRVMQNLIDHSVKLTDAGGIIVEVDADVDNTYIRLLDTGVGIDEDFVPRMFDDFQASFMADGEQAHAAGLGLGISKRLIELMGGSISVESIKNEGSVFTLTLPTAFPRGKNKLVPRLLVADASQDVHTMIEFLLASHFSVDIVSDLDELYRQIKRAPYDLIMVDVGLSNDRFIENLITKVRERKQFETIPFIAVDPLPRKGSEAKWMGLGFEYYVTKPFGRSKLLDLLSLVLWERINLTEEEESDHSGHGTSLSRRRASA